MLSDVKPCPDLSRGVVTAYVDNFAALSTDAARSRELNAAVHAEVQQLGLDTHEYSDDAECADLLGMHFGGGRVSPKGDRRWRLYHALSFVMKKGRVNSKQLAIIVGHFTYSCMLRRELLSLMRACYTFITAEYKSPRRIWPSVRRELLWIQSLLCLVECDLHRPWSSETYVFDASPWGAGACRGNADPGLVKSIGSFNERWRFKNHENVSMRVLASKGILQQVLVESGAEAMSKVREKLQSKMGGALLEDSHDILDSLNCDSFIPLVPRLNGAYLGAIWRPCLSAPWRRKEHISVLEVRALVATLCIIGNRAQLHAKRLLLLSDSAACVLGASKGRSSKPGMCRALRQVAALCLALTVTVGLRWIPSELNEADKPSRRGILASRQASAVLNGGWSGPLPHGGSARTTRPEGGSRRRAHGLADAGRLHGSAPSPGPAQQRQRRSGACRRGAARARAHVGGGPPASTGAGLPRSGPDPLPSGSHQDRDHEGRARGPPLVPARAVAVRLVEPEPGGARTHWSSDAGPMVCSGPPEDIGGSECSPRRQSCQLDRCRFLGGGATRHGDPG